MSNFSGNTALLKEVKKGGGGKTYTGGDNIVVDNTANTISAPDVYNKAYIDSVVPQAPIRKALTLTKTDYTKNVVNTGVAVNQVRKWVFKISNSSTGNVQFITVYNDKNKWGQSSKVPEYRINIWDNVVNFKFVCVAGGGRNDELWIYTDGYMDEMWSYKGSAFNQ